MGCAAHRILTGALTPGRTPGRTGRWVITVLCLTAVTTLTVALGGCTSAPNRAPLPTRTPAHPSAPQSAPQPTPIDNGLARTPVMGFNDWNAFGCDVSARLIEQTADAMVANGMKAAGYSYLTIDDCWMARSRNQEGHLVPDPTKFPDGIAPVAAYVHARGLKLGIYESAGAYTCEKFPGSLGHETTDADDFAAWGVDLLKYDNCGSPEERAGSQARYIQRYTTMARALQATGRPIVYSICEWGWRNVQEWAPAISNMWRTTRDIADDYASMLAIVKRNAALAASARPGAFNDPDMLEVGNGGMTEAEQRSEFSLWSIMAAPLIAGTDLRTASPATLAIYTNADVIAVDQDALGRQGRLLSSAGGHFVFAKQLADGDVAVALFNSTARTARIATTAAAVGVRPAQTGSTLTITDLWSHRVTAAAQQIAATVPGHATVLYRVHNSDAVR